MLKNIGTCTRSLATQSPIHSTYTKASLRKLPSRLQMLQSSEKKNKELQQQLCAEVVQTIREGIFNAVETGQRKARITFPLCRSECRCIREIGAELEASSTSTSENISFGWNITYRKGLSDLLTLDAQTGCGEFSSSYSFCKL